MIFGKELKFGILQTLVFYIFGIVSSWIVYLLIGHPYIHAPGAHHILILLTFIIGGVWTLISVLFFFTKKRTDKLKGIILTNLIFVLTFIMYISHLINTNG